MKITFFLLLAGSVSVSAQSRVKPVVMPFALRYGQHTFGAWYGVPVVVGSTQFNLSLSTALSRTWIPGAALCAHDSNVTACTAAIGGTWSGDIGTGTKVEDELLAGVYNKTLSEKLNINGKLLSQEGVGSTITESITLKSNTGVFKMDSQSVGVVKEADTEYFPNGILSLQQMALSLYSGGFTPSPSMHLFHGYSAYANDSVVDLEGTDAGRYILIFGGYDRALLDLNTTQQYPLVKTMIKGDDNDKDDNSTTNPLPSSQDVGYRMEVLLEDLVYRWTIGGTTDNSLVKTPTLAIIDSTTPYLWLPKSVLADLVSVSGVIWNDTLKVYQVPYCGKCTEAQSNAEFAVLDFKFENNDGVPITIGFNNYLTVKYVPYSGWSSDAVSMLPVRELPDGSPIILGRPFLAVVHLWVDYAEKWFAMSKGDQSDLPPALSEVVPWDRKNHPPITNSSVLLVKTSEDVSSTSPSSSPGASNSDSPSPPKLKTGVIIVIAASGAALLFVGGFLIYRCCRAGLSPQPDIPPSPYNHYELHDTPTSGPPPGHLPELSSHLQPPPPQSLSVKVQEISSSYRQIPELPTAAYYPPPTHPPHRQHGGYPQEGVYTPSPVYEIGPDKGRY
ncbi:aspartic peptidase domain-containing protein [Tuber borchii]|uniref:Aspartic peptidase domain-containing protein n=1 Tax=Tuber borchii TaxID=42251 RepID=A0A2T6ZSU1_TUBBO|nr:aspartic peptidase domain-containing protein [Tuber borchii]